MSLTQADRDQAVSDNSAAKDEFGDKLANSLTNEQSDWQLLVVFDQQQLVHAPSGMKLLLPFDGTRLQFVDGPTVRVSGYSSAVISERIGEIITKNQTSQLGG